MVRHMPLTKARINLGAVVKRAGVIPSRSFEMSNRTMASIGFAFSAYDIYGTEVLLQYCGLRREDTYE
jgi:hypothetical protein